MIEPKLYYSLTDRMGEILKFNPSGALLSSLIIMAIVAILAIIVGIVARHADPLKAPRGLLYWAETYVGAMDDFVADRMGPGWGSFGGYFMALSAYLFLAFIWSITGLPSVIDNIFAPLSLAVVMWVLITFTALHYQHFHYFHRYIEPIFLFLPINMISQVTPILSTTLRMFGNCLAGSIIIGLIQMALNKASIAMTHSATWGSIFLSPIPTGVLNLYFALFSGFIQTLVFMSLTAVWIAQERPDEEMGVESQALRGPEAQ